MFFFSKKKKRFSFSFNWEKLGRNNNGCFVFSLFNLALGDAYSIKKNTQRDTYGYIQQHTYT